MSNPTLDIFGDDNKFKIMKKITRRFFSLFARLGDAENVKNLSTLRVLKTRRTNSNTKDSNGSTKIDLNKTKANSGHLKIATLIRPLDTSKTKSLNQPLDTSRAVSKRNVQRSR